MSKVSEFAVAVNAAFDNIKADEAGLAKMIQDLKDQISAGLSPEDQAALDAVLVRANEIAAAVPDLPAPPPPPTPSV